MPCVHVRNITCTTIHCVTCIIPCVCNITCTQCISVHVILHTQGIIHVHVHNVF